jgi:hypothetical protein
MYIPPLQSGYVRAVHIGAPGLPISSTGLDYSGQGMLSSTARYWGSAGDVEYHSLDSRFSGPGMVAYTFDIPASDIRMHNNPGMSPGIVPASQFVGAFPATPATTAAARAGGGGGPSGDKIQQAFARIRAKLEGAMRTAGKLAQADIEGAIDTPVGRNFAGGVSERSLPGQPPRTETGQLLGNVESAVFSNPNAVGFAVGSSRPETPEVPVELERGAGRVLPRPYMQPAFVEWKTKGGQIIRQALQA